MAIGARLTLDADIGISTTGIAGPTGGTKDKPVGLVYIAVAVKDEVVAHKCNFSGTRDEVRAEAVKFAKNLAFDTAKKLLTQGEI